MAEYREITVFTDGSGKDVRVYLDGKRREWPVSVIGYRDWPSKETTGQIIKIRVPRDNAPLIAAALNIAAIVLALSAIVMILLK